MPSPAQLGSGWAGIRTGVLCLLRGTLWGVTALVAGCPRRLPFPPCPEASSKLSGTVLSLSSPLSPSLSLPFLLPPSLPPSPVSFPPLPPAPSLLQFLCLPFPLGTAAPCATGPHGCSSALPRSPGQPLDPGRRLQAAGAAPRSCPSPALPLPPQTLAAVQGCPPPAYPPPSASEEVT